MYYSVSTASLYRVGARSLRLQCSVPHQTNAALKTTNLKFVRSKSSKASATSNSGSTSTSTKLEAKLKERAEKGDVPSETEKVLLPWEEYLTIRKNKRRWETVSSMSPAAERTT